VAAVAVPRTADLIGDAVTGAGHVRERSAFVKVSRTPAGDTLAPRTGPVSEKQQFVKVSRTPAGDTLAPRTGPVSEKQQSTKSRLLRWCSALAVPRGESLWGLITAGAAGSVRSNGRMRVHAVVHGARRPAWSRLAGHGLRADRP
jgi:hypothetical protein